MGYVSCQEDINEQQGDNAHQHLHDAKQSFIASPGQPPCAQKKESQREMVQEIARLKKHVAWLEEQLLWEKTKRKQLQSQIAQQGNQRERSKSRQPQKNKKSPDKSHECNGFSSSRVKKQQKKSQKTHASSNPRVIHPILEIRLTQDTGQPIVKKLEPPSRTKHEWSEWRRHYL